MNIKRNQSSFSIKNEIIFNFNFRNIFLSFSRWNLSGWLEIKTAWLTEAQKRRSPPVFTPHDGTGTGSAPKPSAGTIGHQSKLPKDLDWNDILNEKRLGRLDALEERQQWVPKRNRSHFNYRNLF